MAVSVDALTGGRVHAFGVAHVQFFAEQRFGEISVFSCPPDSVLPSNSAAKDFCRMASGRVVGAKKVPCMPSKASFVFRRGGNARRPS